jgi:hypothetical protein
LPDDEELRDLDRKLKQLRLDYERYFLGTRPREPLLLRSEVEKLMVVHANTAIKNTATRFKFQSICSRYQAFKRQWTDTLRKMEQGTYARHRFRAELHDRERAGGEGQAPQPGGAPALFQEYRDARLACGQAVDKLTPRKLEAIIEEQRSKLKERFGDAKFRFRVVVEDGRAKLKASRVKKQSSG